MVGSFKKGKVFRAKEIQETLGGKGLNVARVIKQLDEAVMTTGFLGGRNGEFVDKGLNSLGIKNFFVKIKGETRNCIAILSEDGSQTEVLEPGPTISNDEIKRFYEKFEKLIKETSIISASGSIPDNVPIDIYNKLITRAKKENIKFILDTSGQALIEGIKASPYLIKPNKEELESIMGINIETEKDLIECGKKLNREGIEIVVVSLGKEGSIAIHKNTFYRVKIPNIKAVNPVGSGDSMIAGFAVALKKNFSFKEMIAFASACGTANAMEKETGKVSLENLKKIKNKIKIDEISL